MEEMFGLSMNVIMVVLLAIFLGAMSIVAVLAWRNRIMVKMGLRNIPRRRGQTALIIIGVMLSTVIIAAAFGTGDTLSFSIRKEAIKSLATIDEIIIPARAGSEDIFGSTPYIPYERFQQLQVEIAGLEIIDGMTPVIDEEVPAMNPRTSLSEGGLRIVGVDPALLEGFDAFTLTSGESVRLQDLRDNEVYITDRAAEELDAIPGDELRIFLGDEPLSISVKGVINRNGLAGGDPTLLVHLERAQSMFDRAGQINTIVVSNRGDALGGAELSREVAQVLRVLFNDREVASQLKDLLGQEQVLKAIEKEEETLRGDARESASQFREELLRPELSDELISLLADQDVIALVMDILEQEELQDVEREAATLFLELAEFRVLEVKRQVLNAADMAGSSVTTMFMTMGMFSVVVGVLLIFLIFVMLAAARRPEMGMARAVGAKRRHIVQMFVFEGTAYALVAAAIGVVLGLTVSALMITGINQIFSGIAETEGFRLTPQFATRTIVVSYCLGMVFTFATVAVSSYRVSRLNIVAAIRGLPTPATTSTTNWREVLVAPWRAFMLPFRLAGQSVLALVTLHPLRALAYLLGMPRAIISVPIAFNKSTFQVLGHFFMQGWLAFILGLLLAFVSANVWEREALFYAGVSLMIIGIGLMIRTGLRRTSMRPDVRDRIAFTFAGVVMLAFWILPVSIVKSIVGELEGDFDMFFVSGIFMVAAAVWTVMYNTDLLLKALAFVTRPIGKLRPVLVTAVAYPMSAKLRTGLTLAMFALVIFTLMVISVLTETFSTQFADAEIITGGWDIEGEVNALTPIEDIRQSIADEPSLQIGDFEAIGGYTWVGIQARQVGADQQQWEFLGVWAANDDFLKAAGYEFKLIAEGYGTTAEEVWQALRNDATLAVLGGNVVGTRAGAEDWRPKLIESVHYEDETMSPVDLQLREPRTGVTAQVTVIGILDRDHEVSYYMLTSKSVLDDALPFPVPITHYRFKVTEGVDMEQVAKSLESSFLEHGMETEVLEEQMKKAASAGRAFLRLFIGFMALGLVVGIAALGVVSTRAVVERRQQIGVLRAIGYRRGMIQLSFLLESSFISLLGIAIGTTLGITLGYQAYTDIRDEESMGTIRFVVPWVQVGVILGLTYLFSLLATFFPARQAARIYPAEALRYE
ncbi:MAG: FtsX-like permease family protein [Chloroflexota bacterium]